MRHCVPWLVSVLALPLSAAGPASGQTPTTAPLASRMVSVGGHAMRVQTAGLDSRVAGQPIVVFQNGAGSPLETWGTVPARLAELAPVVVYDRNTIGESEWDGETGTPAHVTERLWQLLATLGAEPPYVLVGWSWGGDLVRYHAGHHPDDVAGLVYLDPAGHSPAAELGWLDAIGVGEEALEAMEEFEDRARESAEPDGRREAESAYVRELFDARTEPEYGPVPAVPAAVIFAGRHEYPPADALRGAGVPEAGLPLFGLEYHEARLHERIARVGEWALDAPGGLLLVASARGHAVHQEDSDLVVEVIRRIMSEAATP